MSQEAEKSLNDFAADNVVTGMLLLCKEALITAIQDRRLHRGHLRVLAAIASYMNLRTAKAFPSREAIADVLEMPVKTVTNLLLELRALKYLIAEKQAVEEAERRRMTVYTFGAAIDRETIQRTITEVIMQMRAAGKEPAAYATQADENPVPAGELETERPVPAGKSRPSGTDEDATIPSQRENPVPAGLFSAEPAETRAESAQSPVPAGAVLNNNNNNTPTDPPSEPKPPARKTRLKADWAPARQTIDWALERYAASEEQVLEQAEKFRDHHYSKGTVMADWRAAWRTWWLNGYHKIPKRKQPASLFSGDTRTKAKQSDFTAALVEARRQRSEIKA